MMLGMWRMVLLVLMVVWCGGRYVEGNGMNEQVFKKLCKITKGVKELMGKEEGNGVTGLLQEALYGENGQASFKDDGNSLTVPWCGFLGNGDHRSQHCSHLPQPRGFEASGDYGCFGRSLLGTFLCICTKGNNGNQNLCGFGEVDNGKGWYGWTDLPTGLLQKVWDKIKETCLHRNTTGKSSEYLGDLETVVKNINDKTQNNKINRGTNGYYLGGTTGTNGLCGGMNHGDACVTYPTKNGNEPNIPWAEAILSAIQKVKEAQTHTSSTDSATTSHSDHHQEVQDDSSETDTDDEEVEEDESAQNHDPQNHSKPPRSKRKRRDTNKKSTEQHEEPVTAILHKYDSSSLHKPFWLLSAVVV